MLSKLRSSVDKITVMCRLRAAHLDSASVNSLLASQYVALPEAVRQVSEDIGGEDSQKGPNLTLGYGPAKVGGSYSSGESEQERRLSETERQINDQYRFSILYKVLDDSGSIKDLDTRAEEDEPLSVE